MWKRRCVFFHTGYVLYANFFCGQCLLKFEVCWGIHSYLLNYLSLLWLLRDAFVFVHQEFGVSVIIN